MNSIAAFVDKTPLLGPDVFIAPGAQIIGDVRIEQGASVWFNAVLRGDINCVQIGQGTNLQDLAVCHVTDDWPCIVGEYVTVGHAAILHGCRIENEVLIGMRATLMNGVVIGAQSIIGAGSLLTEGMQVPPGSLVYGAPAKVVSRIDATERLTIRSWADKYREMAMSYLKRPN